MKRDNRGSAIVTVMVVVTFLSVLITTLLYVSVTNYKSKQVDYLNKKSFYLCENALDEVRCFFVLEASEAFKEAYKVTMKNYALVSASEREELYLKEFVQELEQRWDDKKASDPTMSDLQVLQNEMGLSGNTVGCLSGVDSWIYDENTGKATIKNVSVAISEDGYTAMITTDICITAPEIELGIDSYSAWSSSVDDERKEIKLEEAVMFLNWRKS